MHPARLAITDRRQKPKNALYAITIALIGGLFGSLAGAHLSNTASHHEETRILRMESYSRFMTAAHNSRLHQELVAANASNECLFEMKDEVPTTSCTLSESEIQKLTADQEELITSFNDVQLIGSPEAIENAANSIEAIELRTVAQDEENPHLLLSDYVTSNELESRDMGESQEGANPLGGLMNSMTCDVNDNTVEYNHFYLEDRWEATPVDCP